MDEQQDPTVFPIEKMTMVSLGKILREIDLVDIVELSLTNSDVKRAIGAFKYKVDSFEVSFDSQQSYVAMTAGAKKFIWTFYFVTPDPEVNIRKIGRYNFRSYRTRMGIHTDHHDIEHGIPVIFAHLLSIFYCCEAEITHLTIDFSTIAEPRAVVELFKHFRKINFLVLAKSGFGDLFDFKPDLERILRIFETNEIHFDVEGAEKIFKTGENGQMEMVVQQEKYDILLSKDHVCLEKAFWLSGEDLLKMDTRTAIIVENVLTPTHLNAFVKKWHCGEKNERFMWLKVQIDLREDEAKDAVKEGLTLVPSQWRQSTTHLNCQYHRVNCQTMPLELASGFQLTHSTNGSVADLIIADDYFLFHVKDDGGLTAPVVEPVRRQANGDLMAELLMRVQRAERERRMRRAELEELIEFGEGDDGVIEEARRRLFDANRELSDAEEAHQAETRRQMVAAVAAAGPLVIP
ncbi:unnamed protein product [Caenorhabditis sp. 36 PRJEB53466]|nr:unnamed protein product [Caenorhabditis sp. 36 PRJEB53466]